MEQAQVQVRVVLDDRAQPGRARRAPVGMAERRQDVARPREGITDPSTRRTGIAGAEKPRATLLQRAAKMAAAQSPGTGAIGAAIGGAGAAVQGARAVGAIGAETAKAAGGAVSQAAIIAAVVAGGAYIIEQWTPLILTVLKELGIPFSDTVSEEITNKIGEIFTKMTTAISAIGATKDLATAQVRLGGKLNVADLGKLYEQQFNVLQQRAQLDRQFKIEINQDLFRQLTRSALGK